MTSDRLNQLIERYGENLTIGGVVVRMVLSICSRTEAYELLSDTAVQTSARPVLIGWARADSSFVLAQGTTRNGRSLSVVAVEPILVRGAIIAKKVLLA